MTFAGSASLSVVLTLSLVGCGGSTGAQQQRPSPPRQQVPALKDPVPEEFFGMHIHNATTTTPWPSASFGMWRLWDAGIRWQTLEPTKGNWQFTKLDAYLAEAEKRKVKLLVVLGLPPEWASARPTEPSGYGPGAAAEPANIEDWRNYVRTVAERYKGRITHWEIWNEPNISVYYTGTVETMVELAREAYVTLKQVDAGNTVVSPGPVGGYGLLWMDKYLSLGGAKYADVLAFHFYNYPNPPEVLTDWIGRFQDIVKKHGLENMPVWGTEFTWGKSGTNGEAQTFESEQQMAAYLVRAALLHWNADVKRLFWYAWDDHDFATLWLTEPDNATPTAAGIAYNELQTWIVGSEVSNCGQQDAVFWSCEVKRPTGEVDHIVWAPGTQKQQFAIPEAWNPTEIRRVDGTRNAVTSSVMTVDETPVLLQ